MTNAGGGHDWRLEAWKDGALSVETFGQVWLRLTLRFSAISRHAAGHPARGEDENSHTVESTK